MSEKKAKTYVPSPMNSYVRECVHESMRVQPDNSVVYEKFVFLPANFNCGGCNSPDDVVFMRTSPLNKVIRSCKFCGITQPIDVRNANGEEVAYLVSAETHMMNIDEVRTFVARNKIDKKFLHPVIAGMLKVKRAKRQINIEDLNLKTE